MSLFNIKSQIVLALFVGLIIGYKLPYGFFKPWYDDANFYGGELVRHTEEASNSGDFYNLCDQGKVVYVYNQNNILVEWSKCERMDFEQYRAGFLDLHSKEFLERK